MGVAPRMTSYSSNTQSNYMGMAHERSWAAAGLSILLSKLNLCTDTHNSICWETFIVFDTTVKCMKVKAHQNFPLIGNL